MQKSFLVDKILRQVQGWRSSLLSAGGRLLFRKHVLSAIQKGIHSLIEKHLSHFFWGSNEGRSTKNTVDHGLAYADRLKRRFCASGLFSFARLAFFMLSMFYPTYRLSTFQL